MEGDLLLYAQQYIETFTQFSLTSHLGYSKLSESYVWYLHENVREN